MELDGYWQVIHTVHSTGIHWKVLSVEWWIGIEDVKIINWLVIHLLVTISDRVSGPVADKLMSNETTGCKLQQFMHCTHHLLLLIVIHFESPLFLAGNMDQ